MKEICSFTINNKKYTIYDVDRIIGKSSYVGKTQYDIGIICIEKSNMSEMLLTLKHELMHTWLYEHGHKNQNGDEIFSYEDLCEYVALSNNFINRVVNRYINAKY